jgi:hypothetical protein
MRVPPMTAEEERRVKWRLLQGFLAVPVVGLVIFAIFVAGMAFADREWSASMVRFLTGHPARLLVPAVCLGGVLAIQNHLRRTTQPGKP